MTDHLAAAIAAKPATMTRGVVANVNGARATQVLVGDQQLDCVDEVRNWMHDVGDPVAVEWDGRVVRVVRSLADRPHTATVTAVDSASHLVTVTDSGGMDWWATPTGTLSVGQTVALTWGGNGALASLGGWFTLHPDGATPITPPVDTQTVASLPGHIVDAAPAPEELWCFATETGSIQSGAWRPGDRLEQGAPPLEETCAGLWCYGGDLAVLEGRVITSATIELHRTEAGTGPLPVILQLHTLTGTRGIPQWIGSQIPGPTLHPGERAVFTLPNAVLTPLTTRDAAGIGIVGDRWGTLTGVSTDAASGRLHITSVDPAVAPSDDPAASVGDSPDVPGDPDPVYADPES
jgi:hypothetical protein